MGNGSSWSSYIIQEGVTTLTSNTTYYIKYSYNNGYYTVSLSTNGVDYQEEIRVGYQQQSPHIIPLGTFSDSKNVFYFYGSIDLSQSYIKINNETWWRGFTNNVKKASELYDDYDYIINTESRTFRLPLLDGSESIPDYNNKITISVLPYTSPTKGFVTFHPSGNSNSVAVYVNGIEVGLGSNSGADSNAYFEVRKGDVITCSTNVNPDHSFLYPYIGNGSLYFYVGETVQDANLINASKVLDLLAKLESYDYVVESKTPTANDPNWYRVYKSGWIEQGGSNQGQELPNIVSVSFLKTFADTKYTLTASDFQNYQGTGSWPTGIREKTVTGFTHQGSSNGTSKGNSFDWYACGQGA